MQAIPAIPTQPTQPMVAGAPSSSLSAGESVGKKQFSQHLTTARENVSDSGQNKRTKSENGEQAATELVFPAEQTGEQITSPEELSGFAANGIIPIYGPEHNPQPDQPTKLGNNLTTGKQAVQLPIAPVLPGPDENSIASVPANLKENFALKNGQVISPGPEKWQQVPLSSNKGPQVPVAAHTETTAINQDKINVGTEMTIENWRAQFRHNSVTDAQGTDNSRVAFAKPMTAAKETIQDPILAYNSAKFTELAAPSRTKNGSGIHLPSQRQDANSNFIHSNLPNVTPKANGNENKGTQQQTDGGQKNMSPDSIPQVEQSTSAKSGQDIPLVFSLNQESTSGLSSQSQTAATSPMLRLPSGTEVPHSQIVNQVIDRFTLNRTLESGTVTLKLHPQELGELRLEIKIEQDNIKAHITTQNPQVQEILDRHLPRLREALEAQGLNLEHMEVTVASDGNNNTQLFQEHFNRQQNARPQRTHTDGLAFSLDDEIPAEEKSSSGNHQNLSVLI